MKVFARLLLFLCLVNSCELYEDIDLVNIGKLNLENISGNTAVVNVDVELSNPNFYTIKVKPSYLDVYVEEECVGKVHLIDKVKFKKKQSGLYNVKMELVGNDGIMKNVLKYAFKKDLKIRLVGKVKGGIFIFSKKIAIDETKVIDGKALLSR